MGRLILRTSIVETPPPDEGWLAENGLLWADGIEPAGNEATFWPLQGANRAWYLDYDAVSNGNGSSGSPFNTPATLNNGTASGMAAGDHIYVKGTLTAAKLSGGRPRINITNMSVVGSTTNPLVIRSWPGEAQFVSDGEYSQVATIQVTPASSQATKGVVFINLKATRSYQSCGIYLAEADANLGFVRVISCDASFNYAIAGGPNDTYGGIRVCATHIDCDIEVSNCLSHDNNTTNGTTTQYSNNIGGISLLSEIGGAGSTVKFFNNRVYNEGNGLRHKHAGRVTFEAYNNHISDCVCAYFIRATTLNTIHHNLVEDCTAALKIDAEGQSTQGAQLRTVNYYNDTIIRTEKILANGDPHAYADVTNIYSIIYYNPTRAAIVGDWGEFGSQNFPLAGATFEDSCIVNNSTSNFWVDDGTTKNRTTFDTQFGAGNIYLDPGFVNYAGGDYTLDVGSPCILINGTRAGAF